MGKDYFKCPVHGLPDCSPLLNGCSIPIQLHKAFEAGYAEALTDTFHPEFGTAWRAGDGECWQAHQDGFDEGYQRGYSDGMEYVGDWDE